VRLYSGSFRLSCRSIICTISNDVGFLVTCNQHLHSFLTSDAQNPETLQYVFACNRNRLKRSPILDRIDCCALWGRLPKPWRNYDFSKPSTSLWGRLSASELNRRYEVDCSKVTLDYDSPVTTLLLLCVRPGAIGVTIGAHIGANIVEDVLDHHSFRYRSQEDINLQNTEQLFFSSTHFFWRVQSTDSKQFAFVSSGLLILYSRITSRYVLPFCASAFVVGRLLKMYARKVFTWACHRRPPNHLPRLFPF
jgi:hypothetical protein